MRPKLYPTHTYPHLESRGGYLKVPDGRLYVESHAGPDADPAALPLLVIHGVGGSAEHLVGEVGGLAADRPVYTYDARGHGRSVRPDSFTLAEHVADAVAVADGFGLDRFALLGYSMGSYIAQLVAAEVPARLAGLVLAVTKGHATVSSTARLMHERPELFDNKTAEETAAVLLDLSSSPRTPPEVRARIAEQAAALARPELLLSPEEFAAANSALAGFDARPQLSRITCPTLVISGADDLLNPPEEGRAVAGGITGSRFVVIAGAGHLLAMERPGEYVALVAGFLSGL